jgi:putative endonuclease
LVVPAKAGTHSHSTWGSAVPYYVYILASRRYGTLYIGVTNNLARRLEQHRSGAVSSFTRTYKVFRLVYVEVFDDPVSAITREKQMKKWNRDWKIRLIEEKNPDWSDLTGLLQ